MFTQGFNCWTTTSNIFSISPIISFQWGWISFLKKVQRYACSNASKAIQGWLVREFIARSFVEAERNESKMLIESHQRHTVLEAAEIFEISKSSVKNKFVKKGNKDNDVERPCFCLLMFLSNHLFFYFLFNINLIQNVQESFVTLLKTFLKR